MVHLGVFREDKIPGDRGIHIIFSRFFFIIPPAEAWHGMAQRCERAIPFNRNPTLFFISLSFFPRV